MPYVWRESRRHKILLIYDAVGHCIILACSVRLNTVTCAWLADIFALQLEEQTTNVKKYQSILVIPL